MADTVSELLVRYWATGFFIVAALGLCAVMVGVSSLLGGRSQGVSKSLPFESGILGTGDARQRFSVKFYLVAMLFVIFDIEAVFLFAWAIVIPDVGWAGFWGAAVFILILLVGLLYDSRTGALDWAPESSRGRPRSPAG
ncbi:NADH-quinone oxidoreductase subunit A [Marinobacter panjinensis]|uniref:NADH-quinone oxidoreductase subunit A n=1 Tax=Marinobacter panjinensis TaxID=2576384 RepID=A0A4U6QTD8_9GAMM|nr:NADH-quinone oxidoreductase subunit A [Marinobacter panjinensis]MCR8915048.1 NADH-quinone oxidoreductase subunit A [Marinobacter panjinensis]TKV64284.1 NADH-quinone oxidoreductase subunit A [Marinobacter panjinensis]